MDPLNSTLQQETNEFDAAMANLKQCSRHHLFLFNQAYSRAMRYRAALERITLLSGEAAEIAENALEATK